MPSPVRRALRCPSVEERPSTPPPETLPEDSPVARGLVLRSLLVLQLRATAQTMSVRELCDRLHRLGVRTPGRTSRDVSDALRWEVSRGRVHRVGRGTYRLGHVARSTAWRMRQRVQTLTAQPDRGRSEAER